MPQIGGRDLIRDDLKAKKLAVFVHGGMLLLALHVTCRDATIWSRLDE
jgi:hypothetical protein